MNRRQPQGVPKGGYGTLAYAPLRRRSRSRSRSPRSSASSSSEMSKSRSTRSSRERARRRRRRRRRRSRSESSSSSGSSSSSSGSRESSRRRNTLPGGSRPPPPRGMPIAPPHFGKHGNNMLGMGGGIGMMGMGIGMGGVPVGSMGPSGVGMMGGGNIGGGGKDYAAMASVAPAPPSTREPFPFRSPPMGGRGYASSVALHPNVSFGSRPMTPSPGGGKNYANFAHAGPVGSRVGVGGGSGGDRDRERRSGGSYADQARDVRSAGRVLGASLSGSLIRSGGGGGRFDRGGNTPPSPPGRDQFGREREWRGNGPNVRRTSTPASNGQPPVVHGSGFGTFSMASSISLGSNGGSSLQSAAAPTLRPQSSLARESRSVIGGAPSVLGSGSTTPLTRADLVRQHSLREQRQRQMANRASLSSSPPSAPVAEASAMAASSSSSSPTTSCWQDGTDKKRRSLSEHRDKVNGRVRTERCSPVDDRSRRDAQSRDYQQQPESKGGVDKSKDRGKDVVAGAGGNSEKRSVLHDRSMSPCVGAKTDENGSGRRSATQATVGDKTFSGSTRDGHGNCDIGSSRNNGVGNSMVGGSLGGVASRSELPKGADSSNGKSPSRREVVNHSGTVNGGFHETRMGEHTRADASPYEHEHGNGQGIFSLLPNEDDAPSCGEAGGSEDEGEVCRDERRREHERGAGWKSDGFREGGEDFRRSSAEGGSGGEIPSVRGLIRDRDRPDSPRDRGRYNPSSPQPPPMMAPDDQQGTGTLSAAARRASMGLIGRNDWQDKGGSGRVGISGGGRPSEVHKRPRSPQPSGKGLHSACPRSSPNRHKDLRNQDSRGTGAYHSEANSGRSASHASNRHGREGRSSGPGELRHASEGTHHSRQQPPPLPPAAPEGPGNCPQHHQSRHGQRHNPGHSVGTVAATGPRSGRSSSHTSIHPERGISRVGRNARTSPIQGQGKPSVRNSPLSRRGSPLQPGHGTGAQDSPLPSNSAEAGDGPAGGLGETNGWAPGRRLRGFVIKDRLVSLKAEFLELHDMLLESDFQWEQSQKFCEVLKAQLDELMLAPRRNLGSSAHPPAR